MGNEKPDFAGGSLLHYAQGFIRAFELQRLPSYSSNRGGGSGGGSGGGRSVDGVDYSMVAKKRTVARRLYIFLHSIDGVNVRVFRFVSFRFVQLSLLLTSRC